MKDLTFTDQDFDQDVLKSEMPVVVDFWAPWCAPCRIVSPIIEELAGEYEGKIKVGKMNVDDHPSASQTYGVMSIPSVMVFKNGQPVKTLVGAQSKESYKREFDQAL